MFFEDNTGDFTDHGTCTGCGECCSCLLPVTKEEINRILDYIKKHKIKPHKLPVTDSSSTIDLTCPFLDDTKPSEKCVIYEVRPEICRLYKCDKSPEAFAIDMISKNPDIQMEIRNIAQVCYPEIYMPKPGNIVVPNSYIRNLPDIYYQTSFHVKAIKKTKSGLLAELTLPKRNTSFFLPVDAITKII